MINKNFSIFFGDSQTSPFTIEEYKKQVIIDKSYLKSKLNLANNLASKTYFLHQIHSTNGLVIDNNSKIANLDFEGDYLITKDKNLPIGILTADCLPILYYDKANNIIAIAHAGWRGTVGDIAKITINKMKESYNSKIDDIEVFFGPSAKICCYEVSQDFEQNIKNPKLKDLKDLMIIKQNNQYFFDAPLYNKLLLESLGVKNIDFKNNICTICTPNFCSFRRQKEKSGLQMSIIMLK